MLYTATLNLSFRSFTWVLKVSASKLQQNLTQTYSGDNSKLVIHQNEYDIYYSNLNLILAIEILLQHTVLVIR